MAFRRTVVWAWLFTSAIAHGQTVEELRAKLAQADIDRAVMAERARAGSEHPTSAVLIALIGALPAIFAAWLTFEGNKMVKRVGEAGQSMAAKSSARAEVIANEATKDRADKAD